MSEYALMLYADGACRGNPGVGGAGALLVNPEGKTVCAMKQFLGLCTNNVAEYKALIMGLEEAARRRANKIFIFMDSELVVRQIDGSYRVKNENLKPLAQRARGLLSSFEYYTISHVARTENRKADELANEAIDEAMG